MKGDKYVYFNTATNATVAIGELTVTAVQQGSQGNLVSVAIPESGTESQVTVSVSGNDITAAIGTSNDMGADNIVTAIEASAAASALVTVAAGGATHITSAVSQTFLASGEDSVCFPISSFAGMQPTTDSALTLYFKSLRNFDGMDEADDAVIVSDSVVLNLVTANTHKQAMTAICEAFGSANSANSGFISIGNDFDEETNKANYLSDLISSVGTITLAANIS